MLTGGPPRGLSVFPGSRRSPLSPERPGRSSHPWAVKSGRLVPVTLGWLWGESRHSSQRGPTEAQRHERKSDGLRFNVSFAPIPAIHGVRRRSRKPTSFRSWRFDCSWTSGDRTSALDLEPKPRRSAFEWAATPRRSGLCRPALPSPPFRVCSPPSPPGRSAASTGGCIAESGRRCGPSNRTAPAPRVKGRLSIDVPVPADKPITFQ